MALLNLTLEECNFVLMGAVRLTEAGLAAWLERSQASHAINTPARSQLQVSCTVHPCNVNSCRYLHDLDFHYARYL